MSQHCQTHHTVSKCINNRKVPKIAPVPPILYEKYTWLHFTALIIKSYLHWEVQNIRIPFVPYIKENFLYPFVIWKPAWKPPIILWVFCWFGLLSPPSIIHSWVLNMVRLHGKCLFTTNYYYDVCLWMKITFSFSCFLFFMKSLRYQTPVHVKWRPWCFLGFANKIRTNTLIWINYFGII